MKKLLIVSLVSIVSTISLCTVNAEGGSALDWQKNLSTNEKPAPLIGEGKGALAPPSGEKRYNVTIDTFAGDKEASGDDGVELITSYISLFYKAVASIIGLICVLIVIISGIQITMGGIDPEGVNQAKERIIKAIFSLILLFSAALILKTINPGFFI